MTTFSKRWQWAAAVAGAVWLTACGNAIPTPPGVQNRAQLLGFSGQNSCKDLEKYIEDTAVLQMRTQLEAQRDGVPSWGWWGWMGGGPVAFGMADNGATPSAAGGAQSAPPAAPTDYTTTNNQVAGVDEADFVKNDGTRIFVLSGQKLYAANSWPADQLAVRGSVAIEGWPREMFLDGTDKAVVFSSVYSWYPMSNAYGMMCNAMWCGYYYSNTVKVTVVDVSDMSNLRVTQEYLLPGTYNSGRKVGSSVRMVLSDGFNFPEGVKWSPTWEEGLWNDPARLRAAYDKIIADNEQLIRKQTLAGWLPAAKATVNGTTSEMPQDCGSFYKVNAPTRLGTVTVVTMDLTQPGSLQRSSIIGESGEIYASTSNLYVATRHWWWWPEPGQRDTTYIHKFDISQPDRATYVASGEVEGHIHDQFSMDESAAGHLRVATTTGRRVVDPTNSWGRLETSNHVTVFGENNGHLDVVGQSEEVANGETIQSTRFLGDAAFVVTFRQVDPLITFDMADPANPRKVAELTVPGFSSYIHPMDATHLLTIGTYIPPGNTTWSARALQLAIYDVSDLANPRQTHTQLVGTAYGWSEAQYEHKAFNYFPAKKLLAIPFADWSYSATDYWSAFVSDLRVYSVDATTGFTAKGALSMHDLYQTFNYWGWTYYWQPAVRRSVMADDFVYAISDAGLRSANIVDLSAPLATALFERYAE
jgi:hypothetical protein